MKYKEKSVIIHRDENGFGLRIGGQNPVFVDCVHENGAAWKAGVRKDDRIIKVNGTLVRSFDHQEVVHMVQNCTPFVNLTLHSPEPIMTETFTVLPSGLQSMEPTKSGGIILANNSPNNVLERNNLKMHPHPRSHHSASNIFDWLLDIGDDLFQDNQLQEQQPQSSQLLQVNQEKLTVSPSQQNTGLSKLVASGTSPVMPINLMSNSGGKPKLKLNHSPSNIRDNPYYYYKNASDKNEPSATSSKANSSLTSQEGSGPSKIGSGLSIVRSRSSSKMSIRSTTGKYKPRNLRSRLVEDLRSLAITNTQVTSSSLSTSPSSSDLSDCDDTDTSRLDCLSVSTSNTPASGINPSMSPNRNPSCVSASTATIAQGNNVVRPKQTTRRLEIIRELIDTEKTHTERLKHLNDLLYRPIKAEGLMPLDQLKMVFSCHKTLFKVHRQIYKILHTAQMNVSENHNEPLIGKALVEIFEGELGKRLERAASTFCACQSTNTELLNRFTRKDTKVGEFLAQVATQQMLGRLGIKDLLASCFQRLTKYPLLLENLLKATPNGNVSGIHAKSFSEGSIATTLTASMSMVSTNQDEGITNESERRQQPAVNDDKAVNSNTNTNNNNNIDESTTTSATPTIDDEYAYERLCISRALHQTRQILTRVNEAVKQAISHNHLREIWKKTDKYPSQPVIDIENEQLLYEGPLTLRLIRRTFDVYVLLLTHYLVILTREGQDKYKLKFFTADNTQFSPIFNIDEHLATRDTATDENGFYLFCKRKDDPRMYEFASQSPAERSKWQEKIQAAISSLSFSDKIGSPFT